MSTSPSSRILWQIMGGLLAWGVFLAVGTLVYPGPLAIYRALIIFGCTVLFVAFWGLMLTFGSRKGSSSRDSVKFPPPGA